MAAAAVPTDSGQTGGKRPEPPSLERLAAAFPQLEVVEFIGQGGMGAVYKARQKQLDRVVALKVLPPGIGGDPSFAERFTREAKALAKLLHPNIVALFEFGQADGIYYLLMEYVDGVSLGQLLRSSRVSPREALAIVPQICDALQYAHDQGIVHRDIKPENILLDRRGRVKVADFGLAKLVGTEAGRAGSPLPAGASGIDNGAHGVTRPTDDLTDAGKVMGTPSYMAPEQREHPGEVDHRADIYALGVVFYQMLTGELPGKRLKPPSTKVQIDVRLDEVVLRALEKNPKLRYQQVSEVKTMVESISSSSSPGAGPAASPARPAPTRGRLRAALIVGVLVWLFVAGTITLITWIRPVSWKVVAVISCPLKLQAGRPIEEHFQFIATMIELIRSDVILGRVIDRLELDERSGKLDERWGKRNLGLKLTKAQAMVLLKRRLDVRSEGGTLIQVGVFGKRPEEPEEAIDIAKTIAEELRAFRIEQHDAPADMLEMTLHATAAPKILLGLAAGFVLGLLAGGWVLLRGFSRRGSRASQVKKGVETIVATPDSSRRRGDESQTGKPNSESLLTSPPTGQSPRFSRTAIVGVCVGMLALVLFALADIIDIVTPYELASMASAALGALCLLISTILGWVAVSQIRHSARKLHGMWLAVFDGLLFPLLLLDGAMAAFILNLGLALNILWRNNDAPLDSLFIVLTCILLVVVDYLIVRRIWPAVNEPVTASTHPVQSPRRFWRFAVIVLVVLPTLCLLGDLAAANYLRELRQMRALHFQHAGTNTKPGFGSELERGIEAARALGLNSNHTFGPVMVRTLSFNESLQDAFLDLDTGRLLTPPTDIAALFKTAYGKRVVWERESDPRAVKMRAWLRASGANLMAWGGEYADRLELHEGVAIQPPWTEHGLVGFDQTEANIVAEQAERSLKPLQTNSVIAIRLLQPGSDPKSGQRQDTFQFMTREGTLGVLQILNTENNPPGLKLRYKLVLAQSTNFSTQLTHGVPGNTSAPAFGAVIERVLCDANSAFEPGFLNLETGRTFTRSEIFGTNHLTSRISVGLTQPGVASLLSKEEISIGGNWDPKTAGLFVWECATHGIGQSGWNAADEPDAWQPGWDKSLRDIFVQLPEPTAGLCNIVSGEPPQTMLLKTRNGRQVVLEITGFTENPRGVKIRYKLVPARKDKGK